MSHTPKFWKFSDGIVTELEVDAVRSVANAIMGFVLSPAGTDANDDFLRGFFLGLARDSDESIAQQVMLGRKIRADAGDDPLFAEFQMCTRCKEPARLPDAEGVCATCRQAVAASSSVLRGAELLASVVRPPPESPAAVVATAFARIESVAEAYHQRLAPWAEDGDPRELVPILATLCDCLDIDPALEHEQVDAIHTALHQAFNRGAEGLDV